MRRLYKYRKKKEQKRNRNKKQIKEKNDVSRDFYSRK